MSQNDYDVTTNAIVSNNLAFIYILVFFVSWSRISPIHVKNVCEGKSCTGVIKEILRNKKMKN